MLAFFRSDLSAAAPYRGAKVQLGFYQTNFESTIFWAEMHEISQLAHI